jgi:non-canonical purine NTP pyrophosphatase (RdgB/HAM1 family)
MTDLVFITGNQRKVDYLKKWLDVPVVIDHQKVDLDELQSLDLREVVDHKARSAYQIVGKPVLVEDVSLTFEAMGRLPGTFIKWFLQELHNDGLATLAAGLGHQRAMARVMYGFYDGKTLETFEGTKQGVILAEPRFNEASAWHDSTSWNSIFVPDGSEKTYGEMDDEELKLYSHRARAIEKLKAYLEK